MSAAPTSASPVSRPKLRAAALEFGVMPEAGGPTVGKTGARVLNVAGPLKSTVTLLEEGRNRLCLVTTHFNSPKSINVSAMFRRLIAQDLDLPLSHVLLCVSHNHTDMKVAENQLEAYDALSMPLEKVPEPTLLPLGQELLEQLRHHA